MSYKCIVLIAFQHCFSMGKNRITKVHMQFPVGIHIPYYKLPNIIRQWIVSNPTTSLSLG